MRQDAAGRVLMEWSLDDIPRNQNAARMARPWRQKKEELAWAPTAGDVPLEVVQGKAHIADCTLVHVA
jgi:hypothetical protein